MSEKSVRDMNRKEHDAALRAAKGAMPRVWSSRDRPSVEVVAPPEEEVLMQLAPYAARAGIVDPEALKMANLSGIKLKASGKVDRPADFIQAFKAAKPHVFREPPREKHLYQRALRAFGYTGRFR